MMVDTVIALLEHGLLPDFVLRTGIRRLLHDRLKDEKNRQDMAKNYLYAFIDSMRNSPAAVSTEDANAQHHDVPSAFFQLILGPRLKYSCCLFNQDSDSLSDAEEQMLELTCKRAEIKDGMSILELGCGWGSMTLWMAEHLPASRITAVSNSESQRKFIETAATQKNLQNVHVITCDMNRFETESAYDRIVSVEMFEHMRNWELMLHRMRSWLSPEGKAFIHIFCHRTYAYLFEREGSADWMGRHFFTGGMMPSEHLMFHFNPDMTVERHWCLKGTHYQKTLLAWLQKLDSDHPEIRRVLGDCYGKRQARIWLNRWRMFLWACAELFGYDKGNQWYVAHYRLKPSGFPERSSHG